MAAFGSPLKMGLSNLPVCFVCGSVGADSLLHIKPRDKGAYFPFLEHHDPPKGARLPGQDGIVASCRVCFSFLNQQWDSFERTKTPAIKRLYWLKRTDNGTFTGAEMRIQGEYAAQVMGLQYTPGTAGFGVSGSGYPDFGSPSHVSASPMGFASPTKMKSEPENGALDLSVAAPKPKARLEKGVHETKSVVCFTCIVEHPANHCRYIASRKPTNGDAFFPFLERMDSPKGGQPLNAQGLARVCRSCYSTLHKQWKAYNTSKVPEDDRIYKINDEPLPIFLEVKHKKHSEPDYMEFQEVCYLCSQVYHKDSMKLLYTRPPDVSSKHSMYFPFIATLQKPKKARDMDVEGRVMSCRACYSYLQRQWQNYQSDGIPLHKREFVLRPLSTVGGKSTPTPSPSPSVTPSKTPTGVSQPLKIQISQSNPSDVTTTPGLLAIAPPVAPHMVTAAYPGYPVAAVPPTITTTAIKQEKPDRHSVFCYICGYKCTGGKFYSIKLYLNSKQSMKEGNPEPFFPFLGDREAAPNANKVQEDGSVQSCRYCYYSLLRQWHDYERAGGTNRFTRLYNTRSFICYICGLEESRSKVRTIAVHRFPFVKDIKPPDQATIIEDTISVVVCGQCEGYLYTQHLDFEKRGIPPSTRTYSIPPSRHQTKGSSKDEEERPASRRSHGDSQQQQDADTDSSKEDASDQGTYANGFINATEMGLSQGSKPPPLTMVSPASKMTRTTATVPPMNQVSPSSSITSVGNNAAMNATRTSSFAAALRKLAKQAGDPADGTAAGRDGIRETSPASTSPRTPTPKRGHGSSGYNHGLSQGSIVNSPPVVTIAPTTLHSTHLSSDDHKSIERGNLANSTGPMIEPPGIKQERDKMAPSLANHERREDDHHLSKDRTTPKMSSHSVISSAGPSREEPVRGFQPYRPGEDPRGAPHLPPHAFAGLDPAYSAAAYHSAAAAVFMPPHAFTHPAFRLDDPLLERYRMMQPHAFMPYPHHPSMLPPGLSQLLPGGARYPSDLLAAHQFPLMSPSAKLPDHRSPASDSREKGEEERRREHEERERERQRELEREREQRERERRQQEERERMEQEKERERRERERMERERAEREREREWQRNQEQRGEPSNNDPGGPYKAPVFPSYPPGKAEDLAKWHRDQQNLMQKKELDRRLMHQQFLMEQDLYMQHERERRQGVDKREERSAPLSLTKHQSDEHPSFHRPFETLANGYDSNHYDYERKLMTESILAQDRQILEHHRLQAARSHQAQDLRTMDRNHTDHVNNHDHVDKAHGVHKPHHNEVVKPAPSPHAHRPAQHNKEYVNNYHVKPQEEDKKDIVTQNVQKSQLTSKLDVEEQRLRKARQNEKYSSDNSDCDSELEESIIQDEEHKRQRCMLISSGPPLQLDRSPAKMKYLKQFKLTTKERRGDMDYLRKRKRRKIYREPSVSPVEVEEREQCSPLQYPSPIHPDSLNREPDYRHKAHFMRDLKLQSVTLEKRREMDIIRQACEIDRQRRNGYHKDSPATPNNALPHFNHKHSGITLLQGVKRKHHEVEPASNGHMEPSQYITLSQLQERHLLAKRGSERQRQDSEVSTTSSVDDRPKHRSLTREFAQEFHESVLATTRQQAEMKAHGANMRSSERQVDVRYHLDEKIAPATSSKGDQRPSSVSSHHSAQESQGGSSDKVIKSEPPIKWPGIEALIESYQKHNEEQHLEKQVLLERCHHLQSQNYEKNQSFEQLREQMRDFLKNKEHLNKERIQLQANIDNLKKCLKLFR